MSMKPKTKNIYKSVMEQSMKEETFLLKTQTKPEEINKSCWFVFYSVIKARISIYSSYPFNLHQQFFLVKIWSNWETKVSFRFCSSRRFQNTPWKSKLTKILWSNGLLQKPILLIVKEKFYEQNLVASISHSIFDQIKFPGGVLESS